MAIRLRVVPEGLVALCAARSVAKPGDVYLDDSAHYALAEKFWRDYPEVQIQVAPEIVAAVEREETKPTPCATCGHHAESHDKFKGHCRASFRRCRCGHYIATEPTPPKETP